MDKMERPAPPATAFTARDSYPRDFEEVLGWVSDSVSGHHHLPLVIWRHGGRWCAGIPGWYTDLGRKGWTVTHWTPLHATVQVASAAIAEAIA